MTANSWQPADPEVARVLDRLRAGESALISRVEALEEAEKARWQASTEGRITRRTRMWQVTLAVVTGLVLPVSVVGILALLHLGG